MLQSFLKTAFELMQSALSWLVPVMRAIAMGGWGPASQIAQESFRRAQASRVDTQLQWKPNKHWFEDNFNAIVLTGISIVGALSFFYAPFVMEFLTSGALHLGQLFAATGLLSFFVWLNVSALTGSTLPETIFRMQNPGAEAYAADDPLTSKAQRIVDRVRQKAGILVPIPVTVWHLDNPNAYAAGDKSSARVGIADSLLENYTEEEIEGVIAHEIGHIQNRHVKMGAAAAYFTIVFATFSLLALAGAGIPLLSPFLTAASGLQFFSIPLPLLGSIPITGLTLLKSLITGYVVSHVIRQNEFTADKTAARITGNPEALASALAKLSPGYEKEPTGIWGEAVGIFRGAANAVTMWRHTAWGLVTKPSLGRLFLLLITTLALPVMIFPTHPPVKRRIERLRKMAATRPAENQTGVDVAEPLPA
jgi:Zn-dependent protease with chaperone function